MSTLSLAGVGVASRNVIGYRNCLSSFLTASKRRLLWFWRRQTDFIKPDNTSNLKYDWIKILQNTGSATKVNIKEQTMKSSFIYMFTHFFGSMIRPAVKALQAVMAHHCYDVCIIMVNFDRQCRGRSLVKYVINLSPKFPEMVQLVLWCFVTNRSRLWPDVTWYCKSYQLRSLPTKKPVKMLGRARLFLSSQVVMVNSCLTVEYPPVHRSFVVVDTSLLECSSRSVYIFDNRWNVR